MSNDTQNQDHRKLEELLKELICRVIDMWTCGEGYMTIEIRDDGGDKKAKIKGGHTKRIR